MAASKPSPVPKTWRPFWPDLPWEYRAMLAHFCEGDRLDGYRLVEYLGAGAQSAVFRVLDDAGDHSKLKVVRTDDQDQLMWWIRTFDEFRVAGRVDSAHVAKNHEMVLKHRDKEMLVYILGEWVPGKPPEPADFRDALGGQLRAFRAMIRGLADLHRHQYAHRDVKPSNFIMNEDGGKWVDLGQVKTLEGAGTQSYQPLGTTQFRAPEGFCDANELGPPSDLFSLGVTWYWLITESFPFPSGAQALPAQEYDFRPLRASRVDTVLEECITDMLRKDKGLRPQAIEVQRKLETIP